MFTYPSRVLGWPTRVLQAGKTGQPIVFVHGTGGRADRWARNLDAFAAAGYQAYAIDLPGHGFAGKGDGFDHSVPGYAAFLAAFLDAQEIETAVVVGTSLGGHVAAMFAHDNPHRVEALVLCGSMGLVPIGEEACGRVQRGAMNQTYEAVKQKLHRVIFDPALITSDVIDEEHAINNSPGAAESFRQLADYIGGRLDQDAMAQRLSNLPNCPPTLLVWGADDVVVAPSFGAEAHKIIPTSEYTVFERAGHSPYFDKPEEFNQAVMRFVAERVGSANPRTIRAAG